MLIQTRSTFLTTLKDVPGLHQARPAEILLVQAQIRTPLSLRSHQSIKSIERVEPTKYINPLPLACLTLSPSPSRSHSHRDASSISAAVAAIETEPAGIAVCHYDRLY